MTSDQKDQSRRKKHSENNHKNHGHHGAHAKTDHDEDDNGSSNASLNWKSFDEKCIKATSRGQGQEVAQIIAKTTENNDYSRYSPPSPRTNVFLQQLAPTFPVILHSMISDPALNHIISWLSHGRAWRIIQPHAFKNEIVPKYFQHGRFSSFARQLSGWGFQRITSGVDTGAYYHPTFLRGKRYLCYQMKRRKSKPKNANCNTKKAYHHTPPNFYAMEMDNPLPLIDDWDTTISPPHGLTNVPFPLPLSALPHEISISSGNVESLMQGISNSSNFVMNTVGILNSSEERPGVCSPFSSHTSLGEAKAASLRNCSSRSYKGELDAQIKSLELLQTALVARLEDLNKMKDRERTFKIQELRHQRQWQAALIQNVALTPGLSADPVFSPERRVGKNEPVLQMMLKNTLNEANHERALDPHSSQIPLLNLNKATSTDSEVSQFPNKSEEAILGSNISSVSASPGNYPNLVSLQKQIMRKTASHFLLPNCDPCTCSGNHVAITLLEQQRDVAEQHNDWSCLVNPKNENHRQRSDVRNASSANITSKGGVELGNAELMFSLLVRALEAKSA